jgi:hypothetical protein
MIRSKYIFLKMLMIVISLVLAVAPAMAQDTVYTGQTTDLSVVAIPGDTYVWELYNDVTGINFATDPGNCPPAEAYFTGGSTGPLVNVMWLNQGTYFYKVTAFRGNCTMNLKVGKMVVLWEIPTATIEPPPPICYGDSAQLSVILTGNGPWSITLTDGTSSWIFNNIISSPFTLTVPVIPLVNTTYWITEVTDIHVTNTTPSPPVLQVVNPLPVNSKIYQYGPK